VRVGPPSMRVLCEASVLYVYAIADSTPVWEGTGLQGARLEAVREGDLIAVVTEHEDLPPQPGEEDLWTHEGVVEQLMDASTILPLRFGSTVRDRNGLKEVLGQRRHEFTGLIGRLHGAVELGVRARLETSERPAVSAASPASGPGGAYLLELAERERGAAEILTQIHGPLTRLARRSRRMPGGLRQGTFKAAYLVDRARIEPFRAQVAELAAEVDGVRITCTGPWPPYSFSSETN